jgi:hypothetical protein
VIQWWGWLLIWAGLVLALLGVLTYLAFRLFRQAIALIHDLSTLADKMTALDIDGAAPSAPHRAVLAEMSEIRAHYDSQQRRRAELKNERHERRIARAKRIITHDAHTTQWPESWS